MTHSENAPESSGAADEVQLLADDWGVAVIGPSRAVEQFLTREGLESRELDLPRLSTALRAGSTSAQAAAELAANSGRWVKLTEKSAAALKRYDTMKGSSDGVSRAVLTHKGKTKQILEFVSKPGARTWITNPAVLAGAAGIMAQVAMQQTMDEITTYLAAIDAKVDDVLRAQRDTVVADMIGVDSVIDEALAIRRHTGRVAEVTWSKVQGTSFTIARTQVYALSQLDALAAKVERETKIGDIAKVAGAAEKEATEWLAVLARCFQLQDAIAVLELDRVFDSEPTQVEEHRLGIHAARQNRRDVLARSTQRLMERLGYAADLANAKVLLHPLASGSVVRSSSSMIGAVADFHGAVGIDSVRGVVDQRSWASAAMETRDVVVASGAAGLAAAKRGSRATVGRTRSMAERVSGAITDGVGRIRRVDDTTE